MAQHFQSGSSYGAPYSAGSYYPPYQQFPSQPPSSTPPFAQQNARPNGGYQPSPNLNLGRFETNSQAPAPAQNFSFAPAPFNPDIFKQFANASIPPPPPPNFPPVPLPNLGFPQFAQSYSPAHKPTFQQPQSEQTVPEASDGYDPRFPQQMAYSTGSGPQYSPHQEPQSEAQANEGGGASSRTISQEDYTKENFEPSSKDAYPSNFDGSAFSRLTQLKDSSMPDVIHVVPQGGNFTPFDALPRQNYPTQGSADRQDVIFSNAKSTPAQQKPPSAAQANSPPGNDGLSSNLKPVLRNYENKTASELRQLAKGALLSLAPHSIHYPELVKQGIAEGVLQQLYEELGIKVQAQEATQLPKTDAAPEATGPSTLNQQSSLATGLTASAQVPQIVAPAVDASVVRPPPAVSPSLERKDRIAQLLAAKTGRPSPARSFSESGASAAVVEARLGDETGSNTARADEASTHQADHDMKSKGVVQAEALKQKMDRLRAEAFAKAQLESRTVDGAASSPTTNYNKAALQISTQTSAQDAGPLSSIPGLFMTSADLTRAGHPFATTLWDQNAVADTTRTPQKRPFEHVIQQSEAEPSAKRRNTGGTDAMEIGGSTEDEASEGEVVDPDDERKVPAIEAPPVTSSMAAFANVNNNMIAPPGPSQSFSNHNISPFANQAKTRLTSAQIAEKAEMLKARFLRQRAERQQALQEGLPGLDAEVQKTRSRLTQQQSQLSQVRLHISKLERELLEARSQQESLLEEIAQLEKQLTEGVTGQRQCTDELRKLNSEQNIPARVVDEVSTDIATTHQHEETPEVNTEHEPADVEHSRDTSRSEHGHDADVLALPVDKNAPADILDSASAAEERLSPEETYEEPSGTNSRVDDEISADEDDNGVDNENAVEDELINAYDITAQEEDNDHHGFEEPTADYEDDGEIQEGSDGSASMSDSGAEDGENDEGEYEPDEADPSHAMDMEESDEGEYDPEDVALDNVSPMNQEAENVAGDENEARDEAEMDAPQTPSSQMSEEMVDSPPFAPDDVATNGGADDGYVPTAAQPEEGAEELQVVDALPPLSEANATASLIEPQPTTEHMNTTTVSQATQQEPMANSTSPNGTSTTYHPYKSPLSSFQSFRYNEQFSKAPPKAGFRSLTYSNNIDPKVPLCPTELTGGVCENPHCEEQHFRHLGLSGRT